MYIRYQTDAIYNNICNPLNILNHTQYFATLIEFLDWTLCQSVSRYISYWDCELCNFHNEYSDKIPDSYIVTCLRPTLSISWLFVKTYYLSVSKCRLLSFWFLKTIIYSRLRCEICKKSWLWYVLVCRAHCSLLTKSLFHFGCIWSECFISL